MRIVLASSRVVTLAELHQWRTYAGLLAGRPDADLNRQHVEWLLQEAQRHVIDGAEPHLIQPTSTPGERQKDGTEPRGARLPAVSCVAVLNSGALERAESEPYSTLTVAWFQEEFAPPIAATIEGRIMEIDWEAEAKDWCL